VQILASVQRLKAITRRSEDEKGNGEQRQRQRLHTG
jgi:hypothetical protein